jgi:hypothetical protein
MKYSKDISLSRRLLPLLRRGAGFAATAGWLTPRQAFAEARGIVSLIKGNAAKATNTTHKLRGRNAKPRCTPKSA